MTLPTRPHAIFSTLQGTQNPDTRPTLQRAKNANAQSHPPPNGLNSYDLHLKHQQNIDHQQPGHFENKGKYLATYGTYTGTYKLTGKVFTARVARVWKFKDNE